MAAIKLPLEVVAECALAATILIALTGSLQFSIAGFAFRARSVLRPLTIGIAALLIRLLLVLGAVDHGARRKELVAAAFWMTCLTILAADLGLVLTCLVTSCGGLDSAGYLGSAQLFLSGHVTEVQPIARVLPFANASDAGAPLGFVPAAEPFHIAPRFPPGLPLVMAVFMALGGETAPFYVAPILGIAMVALSGAMARQAMDSKVATLAAVLVATNPVFLTMALQPMSDVPATFWVVLAGFLLWRPTPLPLAGGMAAGMALLTRPALALVAIAFGLTTRWPDRRRPAIYAGFTAIFAIALLLYQWHIYGQPLRSGYGTLGHLFTPTAFAWNAFHYGKWLLVVITPLMPVAFVAGAFLVPRMASRAAAIFAATAVPYLVYAPRFEDWEILRFLLPALPFILIVCAGGVALVVRGRSHPVRMQLAAIAVALAAAIGSYSFVSSRHLFDLWQQEIRYRLVADWFAKNTPANSVAIAALHGGSLRYYSRRPTIRPDKIPEGALPQTIESLDRAGYEPYIVLEQGDELEAYQRRFHPDAMDSLESTPLARIRGVYILRVTNKPR